MPIYEYECPACGRFEHIQLGSDKDLEKCPRCAKACDSDKRDVPEVKRVISAAAFHLKGGGWYKTDYASSSPSASTSTSDSSTPKASDGAPSASTPETSSPAASTESSQSSDSGTASGSGCATGCACH